jgi:formimidoylglutamate deiminase
MRRSASAPLLCEAALSRTLFFDHAFLPDGWMRNVRITIENGTIIAVSRNPEQDGDEHVAGLAVPGLPNLHCHSFQRGMAGLAERRGPAHDTFWTWREVMYRFLDRLTPNDVQAISAFAYMEMLERGFTTVGEFHYLHHDPSGAPYADLGEMVARIAAAAAQTGIGLTILPSLYAFGNFNGAPPVSGQRRFLNDPDRFLKLVERTRAIVDSMPTSVIGIAPHSLRAVSPDFLRTVVDAATHGPIHIHAAEQVKEVDDCVAWSGRRPVEWLLDEMAVDNRWCLIHATHMTPAETRRLAGSGAVAGLCPITEASLGDGIFNGRDFLGAEGHFGIGTDSNIEIDAAAELRQLEYSQRLALRARNVMASTDGESTGLRLFTSALAGGAQALAQPIGALAAGKRADIVVLDADHPDFASAGSEHWLNSWIFVAGRSAVKSVFVAGEQVVADHRHRKRDVIAQQYRSTLAKLLDA